MREDELVGVWGGGGERVVKVGVWKGLRGDVLVNVWGSVSENLLAGALKCV